LENVSIGSIPLLIKVLDPEATIKNNHFLENVSGNMAEMT
jgi:hypothetical protein